MSKSALGRGLGALLGGVSPDAKLAPGVTALPTSVAAEPFAETGERVQQLGLERIPGPAHFSRARILRPKRSRNWRIQSERKASFNLSLSDRGAVFSELIAGERRWRAAQLLGLKEVPAIIREADDASVLELALIENLQRENLNPLEEALGYSQLIEQFRLRQEDVAGKVGKSRTVVANSLRLLKLPSEIQTYLRDERLSVGHAKVILGLSTPAEQELAAERIIKHNLNVRQAEELVAQLQKKQSSGSSSPASGANGHVANRDVHIVDLETRLRERLGTKVQLRYRQGKGSLEIRFFTDAELERLLQIVGVKAD